MGEVVSHGTKRPYAREVLFDALSLWPKEWEKNLEGMGEAAIHGAKSLHTREDNITWSVYVVVWNIWDNLPYIIYYGFENYIVGAHRL